MPELLEVAKPIRKKDSPEIILAARVDASTKGQFDQLAEKYGVSRAELLRATIKDCIQRHLEGGQ